MELNHQSFTLGKGGTDCRSVDRRRDNQVPRRVRRADGRMRKAALDIRDDVLVLCHDAVYVTARLRTAFKHPLARER